MAIYALGLIPGGNGLVMLKADNDNPANTDWTQVGGVAFKVPLHLEIKQVSMKKDGSTIHVISYSEAVDDIFVYYQFNTTTDVWDKKQKKVRSNSAGIGEYITSDVSYRTGDLLSVSRISDDTVKAEESADSGDSWTFEGTLASGIEGGCAISPPDGSNRTYVVTSDSSLQDVRAIAWKSDNTFGIERIPDAACDTADSVISNVVIDSAGIAYFPYINASDKLSLADAQTAEDSPTWTTFTDISDNTVFGHGRTAVPYAAFFIVAKTDELHVIYVDHTTQNIRHVGDVQGGGGTDTEIQTGTVNRVSGSYFSGLNTIGILYDDNDTTKFIQRSFAVPFVQDSFHFRDDDGNETTATFKGALNSDQTLAVDTNFRLRLQVSETDAGAVSFSGQLQYNLNSGGWNDVNASSSVVQSVASPNVADGAATTEQLAGAGTFTAGTFDEVDGLVPSKELNNNETEHEYCFTIIAGDVSNNDPIDFRLVDGVAGTAFETYTQTPTATVSKISLGRLLLIHPQAFDGEL